MKYGRIKNDCFRVIPVPPLVKTKTESEDTFFKRMIRAITKMNAPFLQAGAGKTVTVKAETFYNDVPNVSWKLWKKDGKIHQYASIPDDKELQAKLFAALQSDIDGCRFYSEAMKVSNENLYCFAVQGLKEQFAMELDKEFHDKIKALFQVVNDEALFSLTVKEVENHGRKRSELQKRYAGINPDNKKDIVLHTAKKLTFSGMKALYDFWAEDETKEKYQQIMDNFKSKE